MSMTGHLDDNVLERYVMRRLSETDLEAVEDHVAFCVRCSDRLEATTAFVEGIQEALKNGNQREDETANYRKWLHGWRLTSVCGAVGTLAVAATLLLVVSRPVALPEPTKTTLDGTRGASTVVHGTGPFEFELFMPAEGSTYRVQLLDGNGRKQWEGDVPGVSGKLHALVKQRLAAGQYYLRVTEPGSGSQHDFAVRIER
jgi:hypothetical protein